MILWMIQLVMAKATTLSKATIPEQTMNTTDSPAGSVVILNTNPLGAVGWGTAKKRSRVNLYCEVVLQIQVSTEQHFNIIHF